MNDRIKELEKQCWNHRVDGVLVDGHLHFDTQKFAELIVRECIQVGGPEDSYTDEWFKAKADSVNKIREHFGVEE